MKINISILLFFLTIKIFGQVTPIEFAEHYAPYGENGKPKSDTNLCVAEIPQLSNELKRKFIELRDSNFEKYKYVVTLINLRLYRNHLFFHHQSYLLGCGNEKYSFLLYEFNKFSKNKECQDVFDKKKDFIIEGKDTIFIPPPPVSNYWSYQWTRKQHDLKKYDLIVYELSLIKEIEKSLIKNKGNIVVNKKMKKIFEKINSYSK